MTPKEKANELVSKYFKYLNYEFGDYVHDLKDTQAKQCALIAVDDMIIQNGEIYLMQFGEKAIDYYRAKNSYLFEVKQEIEKL